MGERKRRRRNLEVWGRGAEEERGRGQALALFLSQTFRGKTQCFPLLVFQSFSLNHYSASPHLLLPYWRVSDSETKTKRDAFVQTTQSKHQASPPDPHLSFAFPSSLSISLSSLSTPSFPDPRNLSPIQLLPQKPLKAARFEEHSTSSRGRVLMNKLVQVGNWEGERQKQTQIRRIKNQIVESSSL